MGKRILTEAQLQARREYGKRYRETHKEIERERQKRFREKNPEKVRDRRKDYRKNNPDARKREYDRLLERQGKTRQVILTEDEKKEKIRQNAHERYIKNFVSVEKICRYCGTPFMTQYKKSKVFCSEECAHKHTYYLNKLADKRRHGKITALDRLDTDITLPLLYKRDKGICKICGGVCDWSDIEVRDTFAIVGSNYPSIDHIVPISKGGSHTWDNVQLAHKQCNSIKSDKTL